MGGSIAAQWHKSVGRGINVEVKGVAMQVLLTVADRSSRALPNQTLTLERASHDETKTVPNAIEIRGKLTRISLQHIKSSKYPEVRRIQCEVREGILFLRGQVSSYHFKQLVQEAVRSVEGIECIANHVEVAYLDSLSKVISDQSI